MSGWTLAGSLLSLGVTLAIFSYLIGDNPVFRLALRIFIGAAAGYYAVLILQDVVKPHIWDRLWEGPTLERGVAAFLLVFGLLIFMKIIPGLPGRLSGLGNTGLAYVVGIGAATAVGGALSGTLIPQTWALIRTFDLGNVSKGLATPDLAWNIGNGVLVLIGVLSTLVYFQVRGGDDPSGRFAGVQRGMAGVGEVFLAIALGCIAAGVILAALSAVVERLDFILAFAGSLIP